MIALIDYRAGNIASVSNSLARFNVDFEVTNDLEKLENADGVIFPGVGHASSAMQALKEVNVDEWLVNTQKPVLGICLGMQLLFESTEEGDAKTLGVIPGRLEKFDNNRAKVPHMGWNTLKIKNSHSLLKGLSDNQFFYFVHSFYAPINESTLATTEYIHSFAAVVAYNNFMGVQFHPEKSGNAGALLLQNFVNIVYKK